LAKVDYPNSTLTAGNSKLPDGAALQSRHSLLEIPTNEEEVGNSSNFLAAFYFGLVTTTRGVSFKTKCIAVKITVMIIAASTNAFLSLLVSFNFNCSVFKICPQFELAKLISFNSINLDFLKQ
jgi:hypothetical protein